MRSLFLQAPSFDGYDGGAGARYQMKREVKSFWFPTWLAQAAAMVDGSKLIDAPPHGLSFKDIEDDVKSHDFIVIHTSTPSLRSDCKTAQYDPRPQSGRQRSASSAPRLPSSRRKASKPVRRSISSAATNTNSPSRNWRAATTGRPSRACPIATRTVRSFTIEEREILMDMDKLPSVLPLYKQLEVDKYFGGYLKHPYMSWYTGRGCKSRCTFCLWPQTIGGHKYRYRSIPKVIEEVKYLQKRISAGEGNLLRRRHPDRRSRTRRSTGEGTRQARRRVVVQRQGQCAAQDPGSHEGQRSAAAPGRLRIRQPEDSAQHQEGPAGRCRAALLKGLPRTRHRRARYIHSGTCPARPAKPSRKRSPSRRK